MSEQKPQERNASAGVSAQPETPSESSTNQPPTPPGNDEFVEALMSAARRERQQAEKAYEAYVRTAEYENHLRSAFAAYSDEQKFSPGDLVQWKEYLRDKRYPHVGAPAIVISYLDEPQETAPDGTLLGDPRDIRLGFLDGDQEFVVSLFSSRRFTAWD